MIWSGIRDAALILPFLQRISDGKDRLYDLQLFDDASRGPVGSLRLLWTVKLQALVASCGAILTVLALAVDPFTQQILSFNSRLTEVDSGSATIAIAHSYDSARHLYSNSPLSGQYDDVVY